MKQRREDMIAYNRQKNCLLREMTSDVMHKHDQALKPMPIESHMLEWQHEMKRAKKNKANNINWTQNKNS